MDKGPEVSAGSEVDCGTDGSCPASSRVWCSGVHPGGEIVDDRLRQATAWWHFAGFVSEGLQEQTFAVVAGNNYGTGVASAADTFGGVEEETTFDDFGISGMAFVAVLHEYRANASLEEFRGCGVIAVS